MACGLPVVLSDIAPHREIVGDAPFIPLVNASDEKGYQVEIERFYRMRCTERMQIGMECKKLVVERFNLKKMLQMYDQEYEILTARF
jgi:glycosyltransferase involved in cell wall biosynthesis